MRVLLCAVALTTAVAYVGASPLLGAKVVHENASPFGTRFNFGTGTTTAAAISAEHVHNQQFRPKRNMHQQQHHPVHLYRPVRQMPGSNPMFTMGQPSGMIVPASPQASLTAQMAANQQPQGMNPANKGKDGLFFQDVNFAAGGGFGGFGPGLGFGGFGPFGGFGGFGGFGFPGFGGFGFPGFGGFGIPGFLG